MKQHLFHQDQCQEQPLDAGAARQDAKTRPTSPRVSFPARAHHETRPPNMLGAAKRLLRRAASTGHRLLASPLTANNSVVRTCVAVVSCTVSRVHARLLGM